MVKDKVQATSLEKSFRKLRAVFAVLLLIFFLVGRTAALPIVLPLLLTLFNLYELSAAAAVTASTWPNH